MARKPTPFEELFGISSASEIKNLRDQNNPDALGSAHERLGTILAKTEEEFPPHMSVRRAAANSLVSLGVMSGAGLLIVGVANEEVPVIGAGGALMFGAIILKGAMLNTAPVMVPDERVQVLQDAMQMLKARMPQSITE